MLKSIKCNKRNNIQCQLGLYIDPSGLLRCQGRLEHSTLNEGARHPILLPSHHRFTQLMIEKHQKELLHAGVSHTVSYLCQKYWVPKGRAVVLSVIQECVACRRHEGGPYQMPPMPPIPNCHVTESLPFTWTGLDYLGPMYIKTHDGTKKVWACVLCILN